MWANRIIDVLISIQALVIAPLSIFTTLILGIVVTVTFGLLLIPLSLIWMVLFMGPLLGLSWLWKKLPFLRIPVGCIGIPIAIVGHAFTCLIPCMGEWDSRFSKMALCETFPFSLDCLAFMSGKRLFSFDDPDDLGKVILRFERRDPTIYKYLTELPLRRQGGENSGAEGGRDRA